MRRELIDNFLNHQVSLKKPMLAMLEPLAARVGSIEFTEMQSEPAIWAANLAKTGRLLELDALVLGFTPAIDLDEKHVAIAVDTFDRLVQIERGYFGCIANMTGPLTLAEKTFGDSSRVNEIKQDIIEKAEAFCKKRPDILMLREGAALGQQKIGMPQRKAYNTLKNLANYYNVPLGIYLEDYDLAYIPDLAKLKVPFIFFGADQQGEIPSVNLIKELAQQVDGIGLPLDFDNPQTARSQAENYHSALSDMNILFTNLNELNQDTDLEATLALISDLRSIGSR